MTFQINAISFPEPSFALTVQRNGKTKTNEGSGNEIDINESFKNLKKPAHTLYSTGLKEERIFFKSFFFSPKLCANDLSKSLTNKIWADKRSYAI